MTGSERPSPEPLLKEEASPAVSGGENSGNAVEASNALNSWAWGIPAVVSRGILGNALRAFPGSFRNCFRKVRNQEKGVLAKGVSAEPSVTPKERKNTRHAQGKKKYPRILGPAVHLALRAAQPREAHKRGSHDAKTPFQKPPLLSS